MITELFKRTWPVNGSAGWGVLRERLVQLPFSTEPRCWVAGGALLRAATGESQQDSDLDFWCSEYDTFQEINERLMHSSDIALSGPFAHTYRVGRQTVQLVRKLYPGPMACIENFDFTVCQLAWDGEQLHYGEHTRTDIFNRELRIVHSSSRTPRRLDDYVARGYRVTVDTVKSALSATPGGYEY